MSAKIIAQVFHILSKFFSGLQVCNPNMKVRYFNGHTGEWVDFDTSQGLVYEVNNNMKMTFKYV